MVSLSTRKLANSVSWSLNFVTRSHTLALSLTSTARTRPRHHHSSHRHSMHSYSRQFSTQRHLFQEANPAASKPPQSTAKPPPYKPAVPPTRPAFPSTWTSDEPPPTTARQEAVGQSKEPIRELTKGFADGPASSEGSGGQVDWARSFHGLSTEPFSPEAQKIIMQPVEVDDVEIKAEGIIYLPEIKYRRILNRAFGPGGWGLAPRGETIVTAKMVTREYALIVHGRLVSIARGEQAYFDQEGIPTATEGCKSNALMRCCKDLGIASELWDPRFIRKFFKEHTKQVWTEHVTTKKRRMVTLRKDDEVKYPYKEVKGMSASGVF